MNLLEQVQKLLGAGFTSDYIMAILPAPAAAPAAPAEPVPVPAEPAAAPPVQVRLREPVPVPVEPAAAPAAQDPVPAAEPVPAAVPAQAGQDVVGEMAKLTQGVNALLQQIQQANILDSRNKVPETATAEDVMAQILDPRNGQPIT